MVSAIGLHFIGAMKAVDDFVSLLFQVIYKIFFPPYRVRDVFRQIYFTANESLVIVVFCVSFAAVVTIIEAAFHMKLVIQNDSMVPGFASLLIIRELGAVLAALLLTSRVGAGIAAEVGSMSVTEQIDALKMLSIDPVKFLVVPRFIACFISGMLLSVVANMTCLFGSMLVSISKLGFTAGMFITAMKRFVSFQDLIFAIIKGGAFGAVIPLVSCYYGFRCKAGAEGVGHATTNSVVTSSVAIIVLDFVLTYVFSHFY